MRDEALGWQRLETKELPRHRHDPPLAALPMGGCVRGAALCSGGSLPSGASTDTCDSASKSVTLSV